ncbi:MAG TPA: GxxExxY protein [Acetobacteraceae bacterium]|jgi:GxxExxY protein|nr:GxxExxY protein [Acetobacteraceae bacterium]
MIHESPIPEPGSVLTDRIIAAAIKVHRTVGPGLLESAYRDCLCWELRNAGMAFDQEVPLSLIYGDMRLENRYRADIIVERAVVVEVKSVEFVRPVHKAQTLTYLRLSGCPVGLLMNFNAVLLKDGLHRFIAGSGRGA